VLSEISNDAERYHEDFAILLVFHPLGTLLLEEPSRAFKASTGSRYA